MTKLSVCLLRQVKALKDFNKDEVVEASRIYQTRGRTMIDHRGSRSMRPRQSDWWIGGGGFGGFGGGFGGGSGGGGFDGGSFGGGSFGGGGAGGDW